MEQFLIQSEVSLMFRMQTVIGPDAFKVLLIIIVDTNLELFK